MVHLMIEIRPLAPSRCLQACYERHCLPNREQEIIDPRFDFTDPIYTGSDEDLPLPITDEMALASIGSLTV